MVIALAYIFAPFRLPFLVEVSLSTAIPVALLTWVVMPALTRLLYGWLYPRDADVTSGQQRRPVAESSNVGSGANLLPPLMVLTVTTGVIDAVSFVGLGHVFTANMTGNVVFIGFALAGAQELSVERSLVALAAFAAGALAGGLLTNRGARPPAHLLVMAAAGEAAFLAIAAVVGFGHAIPPSWSVAHGLIVLTAIAMGLRNAIVRKLAVADVTTTVLTLTITGLAADSPLPEVPAHGAGARSFQSWRCSSAR